MGTRHHEWRGLVWDCFADAQFQPATRHPLRARHMAVAELPAGVYVDHYRGLGRLQTCLQGRGAQTLYTRSRWLVAKRQFFLQPLVIATRLAWCLALCERQASRYPGIGAAIYGIDIGKAHLAIPGSCHGRPYPTIAGKHDVSIAHPYQIVGTLYGLPAWGPLEA